MPLPPVPLSLSACVGDIHGLHWSGMGDDSADERGQNGGVGSSNSTNAKRGVRVREAARVGFGSFWFKRQEPPAIPSLHLVGLRNSVQINRAN